MTKIIHERDRCIGCGACVSICPKYWDLSEDGRSTIKEGINTEKENYELEVENIGCNQDAADACPVQCIIISE